MKLQPDGFDNPLFSLEASMVGEFTVEGEVSDEIRESRVKYQMPTLLYPYLRATITSFFANSGYGAFIFPVINMRAVIDNNKDYEVKIVDE